MGHEKETEGMNAENPGMYLTWLYEQMAHMYCVQNTCIQYTVYCITQSTYVLLILSTTVYVPSSELGLSHHLSRSECAPTPGTKGGGHTRLRVSGWGSPNSDDWRKS